MQKKNRKRESVWEMQTLTLNNGVVLENSTALENEDSLYIYTNNNYSVKALCDALYLPENIESIVAVYPGGESTYTGFNKLIAVRDEGKGLTTAVLKKGGVENGSN